VIGRPPRVSCGCPITLGGVVREVDAQRGVLRKCVTGPLGPRQKGVEDSGYYIAEAYEGPVEDSRCQLKIGLRYYFPPRMCMLQWLHSRPINYLSRKVDHRQVRLEGLTIG
jgi:hypothetical protein